MLEMLQSLSDSGTWRSPTYLPTAVPVQPAAPTFVPAAAPILGPSAVPSMAPSVAEAVVSVAGLFVAPTTTAMLPIEATAADSLGAAPAAQV